MRVVKERGDRGDENRGESGLYARFLYVALRRARRPQVTSRIRSCNGNVQYLAAPSRGSAAIVRYEIPETMGC